MTGNTISRQIHTTVVWPASTILGLVVMQFPPTEQAGPNLDSVHDVFRCKVNLLNKTLDLNIPTTASKF